MSAMLRMYKTGIKAQWNMPNALSFSRIALGFTVLFWWPHGLLALAIITYAAISDGLDGFLARRWEKETPLGKVLDPIADKLFVLPILWYLAFTTNEPALWLLAIVTTGYDVDNTCRRWIDISLAVKNVRVEVGVSLPVSFLSKSKTAMLFICIGGYALESLLPMLGILSTALAGVSILLVSYSWFQNRQEWLMNTVRKRHFLRR